MEWLLTYLVLVYLGLVYLTYLVDHRGDGAVGEELLEVCDGVVADVPCACIPWSYISAVPS
jgi:hypothetical protein